MIKSISKTAQNGFKAGIFALAFMAFTAPAMAAPVVGEAAPVFTATDIDGNVFNLEDQKGKIVVLEWTNHECPYVIKHYDSGNMQMLQNKTRDMGDVKWVTIVSSAEGRQGHTSAEDAKKIIEDAKANPSLKIQDASGEIGTMYDAKTTPHMFVIDAEGKLAYAGAIDSDSSPRAESIEGATNYVLAAVESLKAGETVKVSSSQPYGCSVKYNK